MAVSKKWLWSLAVIPVAAVGVLLMARNSGDANDVDSPDVNRVAFVVDSLLNENRKLTDSLAVVNGRLDECEQARAGAVKKRCPCDDKKTPVKKPGPKKTVVKKPAPQKTSTVQKVVVTGAEQPSVKVVVKDNSENNGAVVVGNHNNVNNIVINNCPQVVVDTVRQAVRTRRVLVGHASSQYTYTK